MKILKYFWRSKVDLILLILTIEFLVAHFITGKDFTVFFIIMVGYSLGTIIRVGRLTDLLEQYLDDSVERLRQGFDLHKYKTPLYTIVDVFFFVVWVAMLVAVFFMLIRP